MQRCRKVLAVGRRTAALGAGRCKRGRELVGIEFALPREQGRAQIPRIDISDEALVRLRCEIPNAISLQKGAAVLRVTSTHTEAAMSDVGSSCPKAPVEDAQAE